MCETGEIVTQHTQTSELGPGSVMWDCCVEAELTVFENL